MCYMLHGSDRSYLHVCVCTCCMCVIGTFLPISMLPKIIVCVHVCYMYTSYMHLNGSKHCTCVCACCMHVTEAFLLPAKLLFPAGGLCLLSAEWWQGLGAVGATTTGYPPSHCNTTGNICAELTYTGTANEVKVHGGIQVCCHSTPVRTIY